MGPATTVAIDIAKVLKHLHEKQISLGNLDAARISVDEEFNIKLFEFGTHLNLETRMVCNSRVIGLADMLPLRLNFHEALQEAFGFPWAKKYAFPIDVFAYGILFMELITKKQCEETKTDNHGFIKWIEMEYRKECSPVEQTPVEQTCLDLAVGCVEKDINDRPSMDEVVASLKDLVKQ